MLCQFYDRAIPVPPAAEGLDWFPGTDSSNEDEPTLWPVFTENAT